MAFITSVFAGAEMIFQHLLLFVVADPSVRPITLVDVGLGAGA